MTKYETYIKHNSSCVRLNDSIYETRVGDTKYIVKDSDLSRDTEYYMTIREISILLHINHPNIIKVVDYFIHNSRLYIVLPFIESSLYDLVRKHRKADTQFTPEQTHKILSGILAGVHYLHENNISHRDLKPDNIMVLDDFTPIIIDFGQSKRLTIQNTTRISTCFYIAPEVAGFSDNTTSSVYGKGVDIWGIGCIAYELFTNEQFVSLPDNSDSDSENSTIGTDMDSEISDAGADTDMDSEISDVDADADVDADTDMDSDTDMDTDESYMDSDMEEENTNRLVIEELFRNLGIPDQSVLNMYNLDKYVNMERGTNTPEDFLRKKGIVDPNILSFMLNTLCIDPKQRYTSEQCLTSTYINYNGGSGADMIEKIRQKSPEQNNQISKDDMRNFNAGYAVIKGRVRLRGISDQVMDKSKRLCLLYMSRYKRKMRKEFIVKLVVVCFYICDELLGGNSLFKNDYIDMKSIGINKFNEILVDITERTAGDLFIV